MAAPIPLTLTESRPDTISGMAISFAFWLCLLVAAVLFALVSLSPKYSVYLKLRAQFDSNQVRLVALELQAEHLQRVINAIRTDKDFAAEMTRIEFDAVRQDEEVIPVEIALKLDTRSAGTHVPEAIPFRAWYAPIVNYFASETRLRMCLLGFATALVIVSFTLLQPAAAVQVSNGVQNCSHFWTGLRSRYIRSP